MGHMAAWAGFPERHLFRKKKKAVLQQHGFFFLWMI